MPHQQVREFLYDERLRFLDYGALLAEVMQKPHTETTFQWEMWESWIEYFCELVEENSANRRASKARLITVLESSKKAMDKAIAAIRSELGIIISWPDEPAWNDIKNVPDNITSYDKTLRPAVTLLYLMEVERLATKEMLAEVKK